MPSIKNSELYISPLSAPQWVFVKITYCFRTVQPSVYFKLSIDLDLLLPYCLPQRKWQNTIKTSKTTWIISNFNEHSPYMNMNPH
ncbi:hypothetical protein GDO81_009473 [Engystomops pustulosus]|uniref:Uncharacterized protein n=1 Tax=Engystomops pustulosus TaxID=76066 RepID=A0AAV7BRI3_ENGPU|nr:hypothetical protein GDO81_009473 [Engystomops pustulosus]